MTDEPLRPDRSARVTAIIAAGLGLVVVGLVVALAVRPPIVDDPRLRIPVGDDGAVHAVFLGGSLTDGVFASRPENGYRPRVVAALGPGTTESRGGVESGRLEQALDEVDIPAGTNLVIVELGSGDVWNLTDEQVGDAYTELVAEIREQAPDAALVCLGVWNEHQATSLYDTGIRQPCQRAGGVFVPLVDVFEGVGMRGVAGEEAYGGPADGFHPSDAGYEAIAELITASLRVP